MIKLSKAKGAWLAIAAAGGLTAAAIGFFAAQDDSAGGGPESENTYDVPTPWEQLSTDGSDYPEMYRAFEQAVSDCMRVEGWTYIPSPLPTTADATDSWTDLEFAERWGFGIFTPIGHEEEFARESGVQSMDDPNADYVAQLSIEDQTSYSAALDGQDLNQTPGGCRRVAIKEVLGPTSPLLDHEIVAEFGTLEDEAAADGRVREAWASWSSCIRDAGYEATDFAALQQHFFDAEEALAAGTATQTLAEFQDEERRAAIASSSCYEQLVADAEAAAYEDVVSRFRERHDL